MKENFVRKIIKFATSNGELNILEEKYIELCGAVKSDDYYNLSGGGSSSNKYESKTDEEMNIIKEANHAQMIVKIKANLNVKKDDIMRLKVFDICDDL